MTEYYYLLIIIMTLYQRKENVYFIKMKIERMYVFNHVRRIDVLHTRN